MVIIHNVVYVGSANLDPRSLNLNYELMLRFENPQMVAEAREVFEKTLEHCRPISLQEWRATRSVWHRFKQHWAYFLLVRLDPYIARRQWRALSD